MSSNDAEALAYISLRRLQNTYADIITRRAFDEFDRIMEPDVTLDLDLGDRQLQYKTPQAIGDFISKSMDVFSFFEFVVLNTVMEIDVDAGAAAARLWMVELRQNVGNGRRTNAFGIYQDRMVRDNEGSWRFAKRRYASYSRTAEPTDKFDQHVFEQNVIPLRNLLDD